jgi:hypothetical protein
MIFRLEESANEKAGGLHESKGDGLRVQVRRARMSDPIITFQMVPRGKNK